MASSRMSIQAALSLLVEGARTNFWGIACPAYCVQPSFGLLLAVFLSGWLLGFFGLLLVGLRFAGLWTSLISVPAPPPTSVPTGRAQLLASYLHEQNPFSRPRRRG